MRTKQYIWNKEAGWSPDISQITDNASDLVFLFGGRKVLEQGAQLDELNRTFPKADIVGCSTAGEIAEIEIHDDTLVATSLEFSKTVVRVESVEVEGIGGSFGAGKSLAELLSDNDLVHVIVISTGLDINGSDLVQGLSASLPDSVSVSGGLSGDGGRFEKTLVVDRNRIGGNLVVGVGFYGSAVNIRTSSFGGWSSFGPERLVTKSIGNVLYELDNQPALDLYKKYLGKHAENLPASGLMFPLSVKRKEEDESIVRTILAIDEASSSITFAGDIPKGAHVQLMRASEEDLIDGAVTAAERTGIEEMKVDPVFAMLVSCVGRKLVLKQRVEDELEAVKEVLGEGVSLSGFYSYGELSPFETQGSCQLHNQTMTITLIGEEV